MQVYDEREGEREGGRKGGQEREKEGSRKSERKKAVALGITCENQGRSVLDEGWQW